MNENDLRDCFAMFAMLGIVSTGISGEIVDTVAHNAYVMADAMLEARKEQLKQEVGIVAAKPKRRTKSE
jgi:hypothetical protein